MKKTIKKMLLGMLVLSMLVNGALISNPSTAAAADAAEKQSVVVSGMSSPALSAIQYQKFMSYLTQEYAPEMKAAWAQACAERLSIQPDIDVQIKQATITSDQAIKIKCSSTVDDDKDLSQTPEIYVTATSTGFDGDLKTKSLAVDSTGTDPKESDIISISITESPANDENYTTQLNLQNELDQAITNNDSKAINTILGKMLTNYTQITEDLKNNLSKVETTNK